MNIIETDVLIVGGGISGLMAAAYLSVEKNVIVITKSDVHHSNSFMAQGGISATIGKDDKWEDHFLDTIQAGHLHNNRKMTEQLVKEGPNIINTLSEWGVPFDADPSGMFMLGKEGGHKKNRVVHAGGDQTGKKIMEVLIERVRQKAKIVTGQYAIDLAVLDNTCYGVYCKDQLGALTLFTSSNTILAGGGYAGIYSHSTNASASDGSAVCMAYRAGAELADLEFVQFHPTLLTSKNRSLGLITEAVRGLGATLINSTGAPIMEDFHPMRDLAPRDVVARKMYEEIHGKGEVIYLDIRKIEQFEKKFPGVTSICKNGKIPLEEGLIPVAPGAHFTMGGIVADENGATKLDGLYAIGECANTGVHGANRLASNSLLEGAFFAKRSADHILKKIHTKKKISSVLSHGLIGRGDNMEGKLQEEESVKRIMEESAGIIRTHSRLKKAEQLLELPNLTPFLLNKPVSYVNRFNMQTMAWLTVTSCLKRTESRGCHYRDDYKETKACWEQKKIVRRMEEDEPFIVKKATSRVFN
jgi:L-aspartate oxidase